MRRTAARCAQHVSLGIAACALLLASLLVLPLAGCSRSRLGQDPHDSAQGGSSARKVVSGFHDTDIGCGWQVDHSMELSYATGFTVDYFTGGYKLICIDDGSRYLVVPEGAAAPEGLSDDIVVLKQPITDIYLAASDTMCLLDALDAVDCVSVSGLTQDEWSIDSAVRALQDGSIVYGGKYDMPDYDLLLQRGVSLAIESTMINHSPEVKDKLEDIGIPVLIEQSSYEREPLGRTEWIKLYGALLNEEDVAQAAFDGQVASYEAATNQDTGKTVAFFYIDSNGSAVVRRPGDYVTRMIAAAGGTYVYEDLGDSGTSTSTVTMEMEKFYATAKDADIIIYNATIDGGVSSVDDLVAKNGLLADFKAVRAGNVWCTDRNMYQQMMQTGTIVSEFHQVFCGTAPDRLDHLWRLT